MNNPGPIQLTKNGAAFQIVAASTIIGDWLTGLAGLTAVSLQAQFLYGSGGAACTVYIQTSVDQGQTAIDIAAIQFTTTSGTQVVNLSGLTPVTTPYAPLQQALAANSTKDGILGDRLRAVVVSTGTYGSSTLLNLTGCVR
ncbi:MAG: hypothetical protein ACREXT_16695 [Gammaproteobacteria bacterium]